ncbi:MAG: acyltransferase family protein [Gemmatimonadetes bacterium]|nr:acyltransferase family protein [Gemmatimonadota bacterium]
MSAKQPQTKLPRYHSLDSLRAVMMMLGLVLHTSINYVPVLPVGIGWPYQDAHTNPIFDWLIVFIHVFRMPVFFTVAGFFAAFLVETRGTRAFLRHRWSRIGVPLIFGWLVIFPAMAGSMFYAQQFTAVPPPPKTDLSAASLERVWEHLLMHLWFLYHLLLLCMGASVLIPLVRRIPETVRARFLDVFSRSIHGPMIALFAAASGAMLYQMRSWSIDYWGGLLPPLRILGTYGLFFLFGWLLFKRREVLDRFKRPAWGYFMAGLVCFFIHRYFVDTGCGTGRFCDPTAVGEHVGAILFLAPTIWFLVYGFLGLFLRYMERPSVPWRYMADASYWMYIVHPPLVMVLPTFLASVALPAVVKFLLVLSAATAVILVTYHYGVRATFIGEQLNGRRYPRK